MRIITEGSMAVAEAIARCRPQVACAYPITPQTHIVEHLAKLAADESWMPGSSWPRASSGRLPSSWGPARWAREPIPLPPRRDCC